MPYAPPTDSLGSYNYTGPDYPVETCKGCCLRPTECVCRAGKMEDVVTCAVRAHRVASASNRGIHWYHTFRLGEAAARRLRMELP